MEGLHLQASRSLNRHVWVVPEGILLIFIEFEGGLEHSEVSVERGTAFLEFQLETQISDLGVHLSIITDLKGSLVFFHCRSHCSIDFDCGTSCEFSVDLNLVVQGVVIIEEGFLKDMMRGVFPCW